MKFKVSTFSLVKLSIVFSVVILVIGQFSCRKDNVKMAGNSLTNGKYTELSQLPASLKIQPAEINNWLAANIPAEDIADLQLKNTQQRLLDNHHVIKIPIKDDAALFFTKDASGLKAFGYKWNDKAPGKKFFTGDILSYSFQEQTMRAVKYVDGKRLKLGVLDFKTVQPDQVPGAAPGSQPGSTPGGAPVLLPGYSVKSPVPGNGMFAPAFTQKNRSIWDFFKNIWCVLTGGSLVDSIVTPGANNCDRSNGWFAVLSNMIASIFADPGNGGAANSDYGGDPNNPEGITYGGLAYYGPPPTAGGGANAGSQPYGGGPVWISRWVATTDYTCTTMDANGNLTLVDGGCPTGYWESVEISDPSSTDANFHLSGYIDLSAIDNDLNDVSILPSYTGDSDDDNLGYNFDPSVDPNFVDINIDPSFSSNTKLNTIYNKLKNNYTIQKILSKFFGKKNPINLEFQAHVLGSTALAQTYPIGVAGNPYTNRIIIVIDPDKANARPDLMVIKTIIHELIHAKMWRILRLSELNILPNDYNKILNAMVAYYKSYPMANPTVTNKYWDHGFMTIHYLSTIAKALKEYDNNPNIPLCFYKMLAWEGLEGTPYWNKLSDADRLYIENAIDSYISSQTITPCL